jgi:hypothetical protein
MSITEQYHVDYTGDSKSAVAAAQALDREIAKLELRLQGLKAKLTGSFTPGGRSAAAMAKQVAALQAALAALASQVGATNGQLNGINVTANAGISTFGQLRLAMMGLHEFEKVLSAIGAGLAEAREHSRGLAEANFKLRDSMRELANLQGKNGPDDQVTGEALKLGLATGMTPGESVKFLEQFEGSIPAGRQKGNIGTDKMTPEQKKTLEQQMALEGARFGNRIGLDASTSGDLAGVAAQHGKIEKVEDLAGVLGGMAYGLNEGRGKVSTLAKSELGAAANAIGSGRIKDLVEMGAFSGVASTISKGAAGSGTKFDQMDALLNTADGKGGQFLQSIGVDKADGDLEKLRVLKDHLMQSGGKDWNAYLAKQGFGSQWQRAATVGMIGTGGSNFNVLEERIKKGRAMAGNGAQVMKDNAQFVDNSLVGDHRKGQAAQAAADFMKGREGEEFANARKMALARLTARGEIDTAATNATDRLFDNTVGAPSRMLGGAGSRDERIEAEAINHFQAEAKRVGVDIPRDKYNLSGEEGAKKAFRELGPEIQAKGGMPYGDPKEVAEKLQTLIDLEKAKQAKQQLPPPIPPGGGGHAFPGRP